MKHLIGPEGDKRLCENEGGHDTIVYDETTCPDCLRIHNDLFEEALNRLLNS